MKELPDKYAWLAKEPGPKMLIEALKHYGTLEHKGAGSNVDIISWAREMGVSGWYKDDSIPWCGLFMGVVVKRAGYLPPRDSLRARSWVTFGRRIPKGEEMLWDILVFQRGEDSGHVAFYVGESKLAFLCYGGNQSDAVGFAWVSKERLITAVRPVWKIGQPENIRKIYLNESGELSTNEE